MASSITVFSIATSSSASLIADAFSIKEVERQNVSGSDIFFSPQDTYDLFPVPIAGENWTSLKNISFDNYYFPVPLTPTGCYLGQGSAQTRNCSESCLQPASIFSNTSTLANCMVLPYLTYVLNIIENATSSLSNDSEALAKSYGMGGNLDLGSRVNSTLSKCFQAYCDQSIACRDDSRYDDYFGSKSTSYDQGVGICQTVEQTVLEDIAGIGVRAII